MIICELVFIDLLDVSVLGRDLLEFILQFLVVDFL